MYHRFLSLCKRACVSSDAEAAEAAAPVTAELRPFERPLPVNSLSRLEEVIEAAPGGRGLRDLEGLDAAPGSFSGSSRRMSLKNIIIFFL